MAFITIALFVALYGGFMFLLGSADNPDAHDYGRAVELCTEWRDEGLVYDNGNADDPTFLSCVEIVRWTVKP
jgi:hypothetical protein